MFPGLGDGLRQEWLSHASIVLSHNVSGQHENIVKTANEYAALDRIDRAREGKDIHVHPQI